MRQPDLFENVPDPNVKPPQSYRPDEGKTRAELLAILQQAKMATEMPWPYEQFRYHRTVFPQRCNWLPAEEAARLRAEFAAELARLEAA